MESRTSLGTPPGPLIGTLIELNMSTKAEIIKTLVEKGIDHDPEASKSDLEALLPEEGGNEEKGGDLDLEIGNPTDLRPVELPLVVKPGKGEEWRNESQARYARFLNAYAYRNPAKWEAKKKSLIARLQEIGSNPAALQKYENATPGLAFTDKRISA